MGDYIDMATKNITTTFCIHLNMKLSIFYSLETQLVSTASTQHLRGNVPSCSIQNGYD